MTTHSPRFGRRLPACVAVTFVALVMAACGSDGTTGLGTGVTGGNGVYVGGLCNPQTQAKACYNDQVLICTPAGTWLVDKVCATGQKCHESGLGGSATTCIGGGDAGNSDAGSSDIGSSADSGSVGDAGVTPDSGELPDATTPPDGGPQPGSCVTYQDVQQIFVQNCNGCHGHKFGDGCNMAANYPLIAQRVGNGTMPPDGPLSPSDQALIAAWAAGKNTCSPDKCPGADAGGSKDVSGPDAGGGVPDGGFIDDALTPPDAVLADSLVDSGTADGGGTPACLGFNTVKPVFQNNCAGGGCHSFQNQCPAPGGKFGSTAIGNAVAMGTMPPGGGMSAADQAAIAAWVQGGAKCNCPVPQPDAGSTDTGTTDAGSSDVSSIDAGTTDAGLPPGPDTVTPPPNTCGNLQCDPGETAANCALDCGTLNTCVLTQCGQQANACMNSTNCTGAFECSQSCAAGDTACVQACLAGKSNKVKNNFNALTNCVATNCANAGGGGGGTTAHVCDAACGNPGGVIGGQQCYCDTLCVQYGDCCNATATAFGPDCGGSTCTQCNNGVGPANCNNNGTCDAGETTASCPADCPPPPAVCGNGICDAGETTATCPADCPAKTCTTFADVKGIFSASCSGGGCHSFQNQCPAAGGKFGWVSINNAVQAGSMPPNGTLSAADMAKIAAWAAANGACTTAQCP